jgi:hypothetical protein
MPSRDIQRVESFGELFEFLHRGVSNQGGLDLTSTLALGSAIEFKGQYNQSSYFHVMTEARRAGLERTAISTQLALRPWL